MEKTGKIVYTIKNVISDMPPAGMSRGRRSAMNEGLKEIRLPLAWQDWTLTERVGKGSFGTVYRACRETGEHQQISAIKIVHVPSDESEAEAVLREMADPRTVQEYYRDMVDDYIREITAMDTLRDAGNIVTIQDYCVEEHTDSPGWVIYIRMEFLKSFSVYREEHQITQADVIRLGIDICGALSACEECNIIHRDIKPDNIFLSPDGAFKLGDFGVARCLDRSVGTFSAKGTYTYMAPEVFKGQSYGHKADQYSLGIVLYRLMNRNRDPFIDPDKQIVYYKDREKALTRRVSGERMPAPTDASRELAKVILRACACQPEDRYPDAAALREALEHVRDRGQVQAQTGGFAAMWNTTQRTLSSILRPGRRYHSRGAQRFFRILPWIVLAVSAVLLALAVREHMEAQRLLAQMGI